MFEEELTPAKKIDILKSKLEGSYYDLLIQLSQLEFGEASLTCIIKENEIAFTGVSRTKNTMFEYKHLQKQRSH